MQITINVSDKEHLAIRQAVTHYVLGPTIMTPEAETIACFLGSILAKLPPIKTPRSALPAPRSTLTHHHD